MSDFDVELEPQDEAQRAAESLPPLMKASELLEPEDETPPEPQDSLPAPELEQKGSFAILPPTPGTKRDRVMFVDSDGAMTPLGEWLERDPGASGAETFQTLVTMGLDEANAESYANDRDARLAGDVEVNSLPSVASLVDEERKHYELKDEFSRAFVAAQRKKAK